MAILIEKDCWLNSQLSVARFYGGIKINGTEFLIVPPENDLLDINFITYYKELGREKFISILKEHPNVSKTALKVYLSAAMPKKEKKQKQQDNQLSLF